MRKIIAIDQDQVLADLLTVWLKRYNQDYNDNLDNDDIKSWNIDKYVKCGEKIFDYLDYDLFRNLPVIEHSQEVVKKLSEKYEVYVVTTATVIPKTLNAKIEWLNEHFPFIPNENIVLCGSKSIIKADIMIDDAVHNLENFDGWGLLFDAPHNRNENKFLRMNGWKEVEKLLL